MTGIVTIQSGSEEDLLSAVAGIGPIAVTVDAQPNAFRVRSYILLFRMQYNLRYNVFRL